MVISSWSLLIHIYFDFIWIVSFSWNNHIILLLMVVAEKALVLLVISLTSRVSIVSGSLVAWCSQAPNNIWTKIWQNSVMVYYFTLELWVQNCFIKLDIYEMGYIASYSVSFFNISTYSLSPLLIIVWTPQLNLLSASESAGIDMLW